MILSYNQSCRQFRTLSFYLKWKKKQPPARSVHLFSHLISRTANTYNTGRFIMYSGITKIYYRKTVGHVFMKPVQIEGTTQLFFSS
jgi:hypothetical protein